MTRRDWQPRHVIALAAICCAAFVLTPVAVGAATGQLVNIADGTNSTYIAKVNTNGQLRTDGTMVRPFAQNRFVNNFNASGAQVLLGPTTATLGLMHIRQSTRYDDSAAWASYMFQVPGATVDQCRAAAGVRVLDSSIVANGSLIDDFTTPIVLKPLSGSTSWCLIVNALPRGGGTTGVLFVDIAGYVQSGSFTPSNNAPSSSSPAQGPDATG